MKKSRENNHIFKSRAPYPLPGTGDRGGEAQGGSLHHHKNSPHSVWNKFNSSPREKILLDCILQDVTWMQLESGRCHWESRGPQLWKQLQLLRVKGQPPTSASLGSQQSKTYQGLLHNKSLENTAMPAKTLATAAFSGGITFARCLNHSKSGAAESHTNLFIN